MLTFRATNNIILDLTSVKVVVSLSIEALFILSFLDALNKLIFKVIFFLNECRSNLISKWFGLIFIVESLSADIVGLNAIVEDFEDSQFVVCVEEALNVRDRLPDACVEYLQLWRQNGCLKRILELSNALEWNDHMMSGKKGAFCFLHQVVVVNLVDVWRDEDHRRREFSILDAELNNFFSICDRVRNDNNLFTARVK